MMLLDQTTRNQLVCENLRTIIYIKILSVNFVNPMDLVIGSLLYIEWNRKKKNSLHFVCTYLLTHLIDIAGITQHDNR